MEVRPSSKCKRRVDYGKGHKSRSFVAKDGTDDKPKSSSKSSNCFKISKPSTDTSYKVKPDIETEKRSVNADKYFSKVSNAEFSTHRKITNNSIYNLKESPNYQSIMDLWSDSVSKYGKLYFIGIKMNQNVKSSLIIY